MLNPEAPPPALRGLGWAVTLAAIALYAYMLTVTLPHLSETAGGLTMFDVGAGYDFETARTILDKLGIEGRRYYAGFQHTLDALYPPLMALAAIYWLWRFAPRWRKAGLPLPNPVLLALIVVAALAAVFDLSENVMVGRMLEIGPEGLTSGLVGFASGFTLAKTIAVSVSMTALLVLGLGPFVPRLLVRKG